MLLSGGPSGEQRNTTVHGRRPSTLAAGAAQDSRNPSGTAPLSKESKLDNLGALGLTVSPVDRWIPKVGGQREADIRLTLVKVAVCRMYAEEHLRYNELPREQLIGGLFRSTC